MTRFQLLREKTEAARVRLAPVLSRAEAYGRILAKHLRPVFAVITRLGWAVFALGFGCWLLGWRLGWKELTVIGTAAWLLLLLCTLLIVGRARLDVGLVADPQRVVVGSPTAGALTVRNVSRRPLLPIGLELPIGAGAARFMLPLLGSGAAHDELFVVPTDRRGVMAVGPASTVRGDPLGLLRRTAAWTDSLEIFVHPITVHLDSLGAGFLRDLEGQTTNDISMSDLAFHALRDYEPGDDRRYIHWRSSAKAGKFLIRQFLDTRRTHVGVVVDSHIGSYPDPEDYELAVSAAASLTVRVVQDEMDVTVLAGDHVAPRAVGSRVLDIYSRAELAQHGLADLARRTNRIAPDLSTVLLVSGANTPFVELQRAANEFPPEVRVIALRVDPTRPSGIQDVRGVRILSLRRLGDLTGMFAGSLA
jgi:uncharacterized protein (DUF58 family)